MLNLLLDAIIFLGCIGFALAGIVWVVEACRNRLRRLLAPKPFQQPAPPRSGHATFNPAELGGDRSR